jgi:hypothetical protein
MMMTYKGAKGSGCATDIDVAGEFTDPGVLGKQFVGKTIPMRTLIKLESPDRASWRSISPRPASPSGSPTV